MQVALAPELSGVAEVVTVRFVFSKGISVSSAVHKINQATTTRACGPNQVFRKLRLPLIPTHFFPSLAMMDKPVDLPIFGRLRAESKA